jgi:Mg-chelatase subunit ChlD
MNTKPTYGPLVPVEVSPFTHRQRLADRRNAQWDGKTVPLPAAFDAKTLVIPTAVAAMRKAFTQAKTSRDSWVTAKREGRIDFRRAPAASRGAQDIFKRKTGASTTHVKVSVLIDASGSMSGHDSRIAHPSVVGRTVGVQRRIAAAVFGATIAEALGRVPTVHLDVFQHSAGGGRMFIKWRWSRGTPVAVFNQSVYGIGGGGNADGHALYAITEKMRREIKRGERGVIMVVSDGLPSMYGSGGTGDAGQALVDAVAHARKQGYTVLAVAIDGSDQSAYYGDGTVPFTGDWNALGSALARHIGKALAQR